MKRPKLNRGLSSISLKNQINRQINYINELSADSGQTRKMHAMDEGRTAITISPANDGTVMRKPVGLSVIRCQADLEV